LERELGAAPVSTYEERFRQRLQRRMGTKVVMTDDKLGEGSWQPFQGPEARQPKLELARTLWTLTRPPNKTIIAEIFDVETGRERRIRYGDEQNLLDSLLSRSGDGPLEERAAELRAVLLEKGWVERS
jgi:hypothetical protein